MDVVFFRGSPVELKIFQMLTLTSTRISCQPNLLMHWYFCLQQDFHKNTIWSSIDLALQSDICFVIARLEGFQFQTDVFQMLVISPLSAASKMTLVCAEVDNARHAKGARGRNAGEGRHESLRYPLMFMRQVRDLDESMGRGMEREGCDKKFIEAGEFKISAICSCPCDR